MAERKDIIAGRLREDRIAALRQDYPEILDAGAVSDA
jgi:hypothetical protein